MQIEAFANLWAFGGGGSASELYLSEMILHVHVAGSVLLCAWSRSLCYRNDNHTINFIQDELLAEDRKRF